MLLWLLEDQLDAMMAKRLDAMASEAVKNSTINQFSGDAQRSDYEDDEGMPRAGEMRKAKTKEKRGHRRVDTTGVVTYKRVLIILFKRECYIYMYSMYNIDYVNI